MTDMDNISKKLIEDAQGVRRKNIKEAEEKASQILAEAGKKAKEIIDRGKVDAGGYYKETYTMEIFKVKAALDQKLLLKKLELIEGIIDKAKKRLSKLDRDGWEKFLKKTAHELGISTGISPVNYLDMDIEDLKMEIASYLFSGDKE